MIVGRHGKPCVGSGESLVGSIGAWSAWGRGAMPALGLVGCPTRVSGGQRGRPAYRRSWPTESTGLNETKRFVPQNKGMKLTKLVAAPGWQAGVPLRGRAGQLGAATASQLIPSVRRTHEEGATVQRLRGRRAGGFLANACERTDENGRLALASSEVAVGTGPGAQSLAFSGLRQGSNRGREGPASLGLVLERRWRAAVGWGQGAVVAPGSVLPGVQAIPGRPGWLSLADPVGRPTESAGVNGRTECRRTRG